MKIEIKEVSNGYIVKKTFMTPKETNPYGTLAMPGGGFKIQMEEASNETVFEKWSDVQLHIRKEFRMEQ